MWVYFALCKQSTLKSQNSGCVLYWRFWPNWWSEKNSSWEFPRVGVHLILGVRLILETRRYIPAWAIAPWGQSSVVGGLKWWLSRGCKRPFHREAQIWVKQYFGIVQILAHLVSRVSRPQFCWGLAILCDPPFFSGYIEFGGVVVKFYSSAEITLYLLADFLLQYVTLFQSRDIVKNLVTL